MAFLHFDSTQVEPQAPMECIPAGLYHAVITDSDIGMTKSGSGQVLKLTWKITDGQFAGRLVWDRLNIQNANPMAEEIAQRQLSTLCRAANVLKLEDTSQLHNIPLQIRVAIRVDKTGQYQDYNEVKDYRPIAGQAPAAPAPAPQASHAAPPFAASPSRPAAPAAPWQANRAA